MMSSDVAFATDLRLRVWRVRGFATASPYCVPGKRRRNAVCQEKRKKKSVPDTESCVPDTHTPCRQKRWVLRRCGAQVWVLSAGGCRELQAIRALEHPNVMACREVVEKGARRRAQCAQNASSVHAERKQRASNTTASALCMACFFLHRVVVHVAFETQRVLRRVSGSEFGYAATRLCARGTARVLRGRRALFHSRQIRYPFPHLLRVRYAMSGTPLRYEIMGTGYWLSVRYCCIFWISSVYLNQTSRE